MPPARQTWTPLNDTSSSSGSKVAAVVPTAASTRPQLGSLPKTAHLNRLLRAMLLATSGKRVLAEALLGHRAGGPAASFELVETSGVPVAGVIAAALTVTLTTLETSCAALGEDVDAYLAALRDQALGEERDSLAVLRELGMDVDAVDPDLDDDDDEDLDDDEEAP